MNDALPTLATPASLSVMRDLMLDGHVTGVEADLWMTSMTFINEPTKPMLAEVLVSIPCGVVIYVIFC